MSFNDVIILLILIILFFFMIPYSIVKVIVYREVKHDGKG